MSDTPPQTTTERTVTAPGPPISQKMRPHKALQQWFFHGGALDQLRTHERPHPWYLVIWLTGVDYFSSLAYQPGIALLAAAALSPSANLILVLVTLLGALPVYAQVARRSYAGQGSIAILENLFSGWSAKILVLVLLGFAATDFVITMTLSAADASRHAIENPFLQPYLASHHVSLTVALLSVLGVVFVMGFQEAILVATVVAVPYLTLNLVVMLDGLFEILRHPSLMQQWQLNLSAHGDLTSVLIASALIFPRLALGLSGFETGVSVMPLVSGSNEASDNSIPIGRIHATRKLLTTASVLMGVFLLMSSFVTTLLIAPEAYRIGGPASGRATAYLAHRLLGNIFGTVYDFSTIAILWFAGASAMAGLINLVPRYLPRYGMAPRWVAYRRPLVIVLFVIDLIVTLAFDANVEAQGGAYATGVLVLILSAAIAVSIALAHEFLIKPRERLSSLFLSGYFCIVSVLFAFTLVANVIERPDGVIISTLFIFTILVCSAVSRYQRARELRVSNMTFVGPGSEELWTSLIGKKVNLVPHHIPIPTSRKHKVTEIRAHYKVGGPLAFLHVNLLDNRSEFVTPLRVQVSREEENFVIEVWGAVAVANTIAYISELIDPVTIFLELTRQNLMLQSLRYILWGEGEIGLMVYTILVRYWEGTGEKASRPAIFLMSD